MLLDAFCDIDHSRELFVPEHWKILLHDNEHVHYLCLAIPAFSTTDEKQEQTLQLYMIASRGLENGKRSNLSSFYAIWKLTDV